MTNPVSAWREEHVYFLRLLALLKRQVEVFHTDARPNYGLMLDIISYLRDYGDEVHHPREDVAFARLAQRAPDLAPVLERLRRQHRVIAHAGEKLSDLLSAILGDAIVAVADVETAAATYLVYYGNHIAEEDEDIVPRAGELLTPEDWEAVHHAVPAGHDPLFGERPEQRYWALRCQIALEA
jgi:hemerythrin-like domain-containing protein